MRHGQLRDCQSSGDVRPGSNDGRQDHQGKGEESEHGHASSEPNDLAICNEDNGKILEDGVDGNVEVLECLGSSPDRENKQGRDGSPCSCVAITPLAQFDESGALCCDDTAYAYDGLDEKNDEVHREVGAG